MGNSIITFHVSDYVREHYAKPNCLSETYNSEPLAEGVDLPYGGICFAQKIGEDEPESLFKCDAKIPYADTLAKKLITDKACKVYTRAGILSSCNTQVLQYYLPLYNYNAIRFMPTIDALISNATNVDTEVGIEIRFTFDEGYTFSIIKRFKTGGSFALSFMDMVDECKDYLEFSGEDFFETVLADCPNATFNEEEQTWSILLSSESGRIISRDFCVETPEDMRLAAAEVARAVCGFRIVEFKESIN